MGFVRGHLQAYHTHVLQHVAMQRHASFVRTLAPHLPELAVQARTPTNDHLGSFQGWCT